MRTTLDIDDDLLHSAQQLTGINEKTAIVRSGLEALIARESARRLTKLGSTERDLQEVLRRRSALLFGLHIQRASVVAELACGCVVITTNFIE